MSSEDSAGVVESTATRTGGKGQNRSVTSAVVSYVVFQNRRGEIFLCHMSNIKAKKTFCCSGFGLCLGFFGWGGCWLFGFFFNEKHPRLSNSLKNMVFVLISTAFSAAT